MDGGKLHRREVAAAIWKGGGELSLCLNVEGLRTVVGSASIQRCLMHDPRDTSTDQLEGSMTLLPSKLVVVD